MLSGIYTGLMLLVFLGIVAWAWSKHNKTTFEELSHLALKEDSEITNNSAKRTEEKAHE